MPSGPTLRAADACPACGQGIAYEKAPGVLVRIIGQPSLAAQVAKPQKLPGHRCGPVFIADPPTDAGLSHVDPVHAARADLNQRTTTTRGIEAMPKRQTKPSRAVPSRKPAGSAAELRVALTRRKKAELVDLLVELAEADRGFLRQLTARVEVVTAPKDLVAATRQAIADATDFNEREINHNFDYDSEAYEEVKRNLARLIDLGQLRLAMPLALELMKQGSCQVEMSDEGLMTEDIEDCLNVVLEALRKSDLPAAEVLAWCSEMLENDRVGFIACEPLQSLRKHFQKAAAR